MDSLASHLCRFILFYYQLIAYMRHLIVGQCYLVIYVASVHSFFIQCSCLIYHIPKKVIKISFENDLYDFGALILPNNCEC